MITETIPNEYEMPAGVYSARWSGYFVTLTVEGWKYSIEMKNGVRGINVPCKVTATEKEITLEIL